MYLFLTFLIVSLILIFVGFSFDLQILTILGAVLFLFVGLNVTSDGLQYVVGENLDLEYGSNLTNAWASDGGDVPANTDPLMFESNVTYIYDDYNASNSHTIGIIMIFISVGLLVFALMNLGVSNE